MHCIKKITDNLLWVGANDRRTALFEGIYDIPDGMAYNSYLLMDEKTVLFDTVDKSVRSQFLENVAATLNGKPLDYMVIHHLEPDHSATLEAICTTYPEVTLVSNAKSFAFMAQFFDIDSKIKKLEVKEGEALCIGVHNLKFVLAPMVHWPEVMVTFDETTGTLFSADAFGGFGALNGAIFADEVDWLRDYLDESRRYYTNIVGKYGPQVQALLAKAAGLDIKMICPLHGFVWRKNFGEIIKYYKLWSAYEPEEQGVMIAYGSIYGNTENAAELLSCHLRDMGIRTVMFDASVTPAPRIVAESFKWSHLVFAAATYNNSIFTKMDNAITDVVAHNIQNRKVALIENGSWVAASGKLMRQKLEACKGIEFIGETVSIKSAVKQEDLAQIKALAQAIKNTF